MISATANVPYAIHTFVPQLSYVSAKSAVSATTKTNVLYVEGKAFQMHSIVLSVRDWKRTVMDAQRSSIWVVVERICSIKKRIFGIINKAVDRGILYYLCILQYGLELGIYGSGFRFSSNVSNRKPYMLLQVAHWMAPENDISL